MRHAGLFVRLLSETHLNLFQRLVLGLRHFLVHVQHEQAEQHDENQEHIIAQRHLCAHKHGEND